MKKIPDRHYFGLSGSLASRVLITSLVFLVIPLLLVSSMMYYDDYTNKKESNFFALNILGDELEELVRGYVAFDTDILDALNAAIEFEKLDKEELAGKKMDKLFTEIALSDRISALIYIHLNEQGRLICISASDPGLVGRDFTEVFFEHDYVGEPIQLFTYHFYPEEESAYFVVKPIFTQDKSALRGALAIIVSSELFQKKLLAEKRMDFPVSVSVLNAQGIVRTTTRSDFYNRTFALPSNSGISPPDPSGLPIIELEPEPPEESNYTFQYDGKKRMAVLLPIDGIDHYLLLEMAESVNLVNFQQYLMKLLHLSLALLIGGLVGTFWFTSRLAKPLRQVFTVMGRVMSGDVKARFKQDRMGFEINILGEHLNRMLESIERYIFEIKNEKFEKETLARELKLGQEIQTSLLPKKFPVTEKIEVASGFISAKEVGGDFYDIWISQEEPKKEVTFTVADASGKGVFACLFSLSIRSILRSFTLSEQDLAIAVEKANKLFCADTWDSSAFVTAWIGRLLPDEKKLQYSSLGHMPGILVKNNGKILQLGTKGIALGVEPEIQVEKKEVEVATGDTLVLFTDGISEAHNIHKELYGTHRLEALLKGSYGHSAVEIKNQILREVNQFAGDQPQHDDMTLLVLKFHFEENQSAPQHSTIPEDD